MKKAISARVEEDLVKLVDEKARINHRGRSSMVEIIIEKHFKTNKSVKK